MTRPLHFEFRPTFADPTLDPVRPVLADAQRGPAQKVHVLRDMLRRTRPHPEYRQSLMAAIVDSVAANEESVGALLSDKQDDALDQADTLTLAGMVALRAGWHVRGNASYKDVSEDQKSHFLYLGDQADELFRQALHLDPQHCVAAAERLSSGMLLSVRPSETKARFAEAVRTDPYNLIAHFHARNSLSRYWMGDDDETKAFAHDILKRVPYGHPTTTVFLGSFNENNFGAPSCVQSPDWPLAVRVAEGILNQAATFPSLHRATACQQAAFTLLGGNAKKLVKALLEAGGPQPAAFWGMISDETRTGPEKFAWVCKRAGHKLPKQ